MCDDIDRDQVWGYKFDKDTTQTSNQIETRETDKDQLPDHHDSQETTAESATTTSDGEVVFDAPIDPISEDAPSTPDRGDDEAIADFIDRIEAEQEYIKITPVRTELNVETIARELYGIHEYGSGRKLPLDLEKHTNLIQGTSNFEFIIHKPAGENSFDFYIGPGERGDVECDRLSSTVRSQYPEDYEFERTEFDPTDCFSEVPHMVRFNGKEDKRKDWMTRLVGLENNDIERSPLANLMETAIQSDGEVLYQVVFEPRPDWTRKASRQKMLLKRNVNSNLGLFVQEGMDAFLGVDQARKNERHRGNTPNQVGGSIHDQVASDLRPGTDRMSQIDMKDPSNTFNTCIRAATDSKRTAKALSDALNHLSGYFYSIDGEYLGTHEDEFTRMLNHGITYPALSSAFSRIKSIIVANTEELANLITVPPINHLPKASKAGSGGTPKSQSPLTSPNETVFDVFDDGMAIGQAKTELTPDDDDEDLPQSTLSKVEHKNVWWDNLNKRETLMLQSDYLYTHYLRAAGTGSGKTVATLNDMLTAHTNLDGPTILIDPSGGAMCDEYIACHRAVFGGTDDIEYIKVPEKDGGVPGMPFFDLRPLTQAGDLPRQTAIQKIIDHYFEILTYALGRETVEQAFVANEILTNLIKAMFDEEYGHDHFSISDLLETAKTYQEQGALAIDAKRDPEADEIKHITQAVPSVSDPELRDTLETHFSKDRRQFINTTDAVLNRIRKLKERDFIWNMLAQDIPDDQWDDEQNWYAIDSEPMFDYKEVLNSDKTYLIDTGDIQGESSEMFTVLFLSHLWSAGRSIWTPNNDDHIVNLIIEESANIVQSRIVYEDLLPQGRKFNLSMGLVMQYPEQVLGENPDANQRAYGEMLNNVKTKLIGNIKSDDDLSESLFHEDLDAEEIKTRIAGLRQGEWVCELPPTGFQEEKAEILTVDALPIPPGHSESPFDIPAHSEKVREESREKYCIRDGYSTDTHQADRDAAPDTDEQTADDTDESDATDHSGLKAYDDVANEDLSHKKTFLSMAGSMFTDGVNGHTLAESMTNMPMSHHADELDEADLLERHEMGNNQVYYVPTEEALELDNVSMRPEGGGELGDESFEHRFGARIAATWLEQRDYEEVRMYHTPQREAGGDSRDNKFDVFALPGKETDSDRRKIVEVETSTEKKGHVTDDYVDIADAYGDGIWIVESFEDARELIGHLVDGGYIDDDIDQGVRSFEDLNDQLDYEGISRVLSITDLMDRVE